MTAQRNSFNEETGSGLRCGWVKKKTLHVGNYTGTLLQSKITLTHGGFP